MKKENSVRVDLRTYSKPVRKALTKRKEEARISLFEDLKLLFNKSLISQQEFKNVFKKYSDDILGSNLVEIEKIRFKVNGIPDLRSVPKPIREIIKEVEKEHLQIKNVQLEILALNARTSEDFEKLVKFDRTDLFERKWQTEKLESNAMVEETDHDFFEIF